MTGVRITIVDEDVKQVLDRIERLATDPAQVMSEIAAFLVSSTKEHFHNSRGPDGPWQRLKPRTAASRAKRGRSAETILRDHGHLYNSIIGESSSTSAIVGTNSIYAGIHQFGGTIKQAAREQDIHLSTGRGRKRFVRGKLKRKQTMRVQVGARTINIPARAYLYLDEDDVREIEQIVYDHFRAEADRT